MADIKTHLRELSVAVAIGCKQRNISVLPAYSPQGFVSMVQMMVLGDLNSANNILQLPSFDREHNEIIRNGIALGEEIYRRLKVSNDSDIYWLGNQVFRAPIDLEVGTYHFSLKEDSFILENMGLYKLLSLLTGKQYNRGLHIFEEFSPQEYISWFYYTWQKLLACKDWCKVFPNYTSSFRVENGQVLFNFNNEIMINIPVTIETPHEFMSLTNSKIREKVFSKWISDFLETDNRYIEHKRLCSETAGYNLCNFIRMNLAFDNLGRLLQLRNFEYYYAKSTGNELKILKVPSYHTLGREIIFESVQYSVPKSQLNLITTLKNQITGKSFIIRNECRFSHGQFNGTPEAKMYYDRGSDLSIIYTELRDDDAQRQLTPF